MHHSISRTICLPMWGLQIVWSTGQSGAETKYRVPTLQGQCMDHVVSFMTAPSHIKYEIWAFRTLHLRTSYCIF